MDGLLYEVVNTSSGLDTLANTYDGRVKTLNYKMLRYPGHREKILFLMNDLLRLNGGIELPVETYGFKLGIADCKGGIGY